MCYLNGFSAIVRALKWRLAGNNNRRSWWTRDMHQTSKQPKWLGNVEKVAMKAHMWKWKRERSEQRIKEWKRDNKMMYNVTASLLQTTIMLETCCPLVERCIIWPVSYFICSGFPLFFMFLNSNSNVLITDTVGSFSQKLKSVSLKYILYTFIFSTFMSTLRHGFLYI